MKGIGFRLLAASLAACGPHRPDPGGMRPGPSPGEYHLRVERPQDAPFEGRLIVALDTMFVLDKGSSCRQATVQPSTNLLQVRCDDLFLTVDRFGGGSPKVTATADVLRSSARRQCVSWAEGGTRCLRFENVVTDHKLETVTVHVTVTRGPPPADRR